jgi:hypothetical protein
MSRIKTILCGRTKQIKQKSLNTEKLSGLGEAQLSRNCVHHRITGSPMPSISLIHAAATVEFRRNRRVFGIPRE